ncbi:hypothetical protein COL154_009506 [Colletotrichum chrysophilum]|nr:hypothetical protein COL154_009506 [Colletotrichum chrysophilum]
MANLGRLPPELKIAIVEILFDQGYRMLNYADMDPAIKALAALSLADRFFNLVAEPKLYDLGTLRHPYLLCWATDVGYLKVMKKILSLCRFHTQFGVLRYRPQDKYEEWIGDNEPAKERFHRHYRTNGEPFQLRADWLSEGEFGEYQDKIAELASDEEEEDDDYDDDETTELRRLGVEIFGVVRWDNHDLHHHDILDEPKAVYWFPVHIAARHGNIEALAILVEFGALLNMPSKGQPIPRFITAMRHSYPEIAEFCLDRELDDIEETHPDVFNGTLVWRAFWK